MPSHTASLLAALLFAVSTTPARADETPASAAPAPSARVYCFGNSLTANSQPEWHTALGASAGVRWETIANVGAGWQLWQHREEIARGGVSFNRNSRGDLTLEASQSGDARGNIQRFLKERWDVLVLQPFGVGLSFRTRSMNGRDLGEEKDVGDIQASIDLIDTFLHLNPGGRVLVYQVWPHMPDGAIPAQAALPAWAQAMLARDGKLREAEFPDREAFSYQAAWVDARYEPTPDGQKFWLHRNQRSRDYHEQVFAALSRHYPALLAEGRLRRLSLGEVFWRLDQRLTSGTVPGIASIEDFYTDKQHIRAGLPRYTVAAAFFAAVFQRNPAALDWSLYNDPSRYEAQGPDMHHDRGELLPIDASRAALVHAIIEEVLALPQS